MGACVSDEASQTLLIKSITEGAGLVLVLTIRRVLERPGVWDLTGAEASARPSRSKVPVGHLKVKLDSRYCV